MDDVKWWDVSWNCVTGCTPVSAGCDHCYAAAMHKRFSQRPFSEVVCREDRLAMPLHWRKPRRVFVNSMSDLFHEDVPFGFIEQVWDVMGSCARHTYFVLTKRPERMRECLTRGCIPILKNVWLGVTVEDQRQIHQRIIPLSKTPAAHRFISIEPMLGLFDLEGWLPMLDLVIVGPETGPGRRWCYLAWIRRVINQCREASVPCYVKALEVGGRISRNMDEWPEWARVRQYDKTRRRYLTSRHKAAARYDTRPNKAAKHDATKQGGKTIHHKTRRRYTTRHDGTRRQDITKYSGDIEHYQTRLSDAIRRCRRTIHFLSTKG